jgi:hypothetical protein
LFDKLGLNLASSYFWRDPYCSFLNAFSLIAVHQHLWHFLRAMFGPKLLGLLFAKEQETNARAVVRYEDELARDDNINPEPAQQQKTQKSGKLKKKKRQQQQPPDDESSDEEIAAARPARIPVHLSWQAARHLQSVTWLLFGITCFTMSSLVPTHVAEWFGIAQLMVLEAFFFFFLVF